METNKPGENLENESVAIETTKPGGLIAETLSRSNAQIRQDRGNAIAEDMEVVYRRAAEDAHRKVNQLKRDRKAMYDFSPTNSLSLVLARDVKAEEIQEKDMLLSLQIREAEIKLEIADQRYAELFGESLTHTK